MPSVKCVLRKNKSNPDSGNLYIRLYHNGRNTEVSLKQKVNLKDWNYKKNSVKSSHPNAMQLNILIKKKMAEYEAKFAEAYLKKVEIELVSVKQEVNKPSIGQMKSMPLVDYIENHLKENHYRFNTKKSYTNVIYNLKKFTPKVLLSELSEFWVKSFRKKLANAGLSINYIQDHIKILRKLTRIAFKKGILDQFPFENIKGKTIQGKREFLTSEELNKVINTPTKTKKQKLIKDVFIFSCFTGLRFSDLALIQKSNLVLQDSIHRHEVYRLEFRMKKTQENIGFRLPKKASEIVLQYFNQSENFLFPILKDNALELHEDQLDMKISSRNVYFNKVLRSLITKAQISKRITMHCGRHTFATLGLDNNIPIQVVQKLLGHRNIRETQIYAKVLGKQMDAAMEKFDSI